MARASRNRQVEQTVDMVLSAVDTCINNDVVQPLPVQQSERIQQRFAGHGGSVRLASFFLLGYSLVDEAWDFAAIPIGVRGKYGDKRLASALTQRHVTFHKNITAFGENLGWKGNVRNFDLSKDPRFSEFIAWIRHKNLEERKQLLDDLCLFIAQTRSVPPALPELPANYLTYAKAVALFMELSAIPSEGHVQQFLVAAILFHHRQKIGAEIITHHPHAADKFDNTCGDIEEFLDGRLTHAYEVTVRDDWKNRIPDLRDKMMRGHLDKYTLIASGIRNDPELSTPQHLLDFIAKANFDLAIVDLTDFIRVFCAELTAQEISAVLKTGYEFLMDLKLSGRSEFMAAYKAVVDRWIADDSTTAATDPLTIS